MGEIGERLKVTPSILLITFRNKQNYLGDSYVDLFFVIVYVLSTPAHPF